MTRETLSKRDAEIIYRISFDVFMALFYVEVTSYPGVCTKEDATAHVITAMRILQTKAARLLGGESPKEFLERVYTEHVGALRKFSGNWEKIGD